MKNLFMTGFILLNLSTLTYASSNEKGNGGSGSESQMVAQQAQLETVSLKIKNFFLKNEVVLQEEFPEFSVQALIKKIKSSDIRVVDTNELLDKDGVSRTCLNYPESSIIECKSPGIEALLEQPSALFVLVFHEYLGLIGVEETSSNNANINDGYSLSKRIAPYVSKVNDYDLVINYVSPQAKNKVYVRTAICNVKNSEGLNQKVEVKMYEDYRYLVGETTFTDEDNESIGKISLTMWYGSGKVGLVQENYFEVYGLQLSSNQMDIKLSEGKYTMSIKCKLDKKW